MKHIPDGNNPSLSLRPLTPEEAHVIESKGTERPFTGMYWNHFGDGEYRCRRCDAPLYPSSAKFESGCGWPAFDDAYPEAVRRIPDADGVRTEIVCAACGGHLGHVFTGEGFTPNNVRHCVNSLSLAFAPLEEEAGGGKAGEATGGKEAASVQEDGLSAAGHNAPKIETAYFAGGCFWGVEHLMRQRHGVISAVSGYTGGSMPNPDYESVCSGETGHAEAVRVEFDPEETDFEQLCRFFFEIHDPTQRNRQGWDMGTQYRSAVFYTSEAQKQVTLKLIEELKQNGYAVVTQVSPAGPFYQAEAYHQRYLERHPGRGCHLPVKRFKS